MREEARLRRVARYSSKHNVGDDIMTDGLLHVSFGVVHIRKYYVILGDNPGGKAGPPLSLSWMTLPQESIPLDEYETYRDPRRKGMSLILASDYRIKLLKDLGYTEIQIKAVTKKMATIRAQRRDTYASMAFGDEWSIAMESIKNVFRRERNRTVEDDEETHPSWISCASSGSTSSTRID